MTDFELITAQPDKVILRRVFRCVHNHWMTPIGGHTYEFIVGEKSIECPDIQKVKRSITKRRNCLLSSSSESYDVIDYDGKEYKIKYDLKAGVWVADRTLTFADNDSDGNFMNTGCFNDSVARAKKILEEEGGWISK